MPPCSRPTETPVTCFAPRIKLIPEPSPRRAGWRRSLQALFLASLLLPHGVMAGPRQLITAGSGDPTGCTETALRAALSVAAAAGGGTITFNCGLAPATITLSQSTNINGMKVLLVIPNNTTIDGGSLITLDGTRSGMIALVDKGSTVVLRNITIANGLALDQATLAGGIANLGTLTVVNSTVSLCGSMFGGGFWNQGTLTITDSTLFQNGSGFAGGGGILNSGALTIQGTTFDSNGTALDGGAILNEGLGPIVIRESAFSMNRAENGGGGAIFGSNVTIDRSSFTGNSAFMGGALYGGDVSIEWSTFTSNVASKGGGIIAGGTVTIDHSTFSQNGAVDEGGAIATNPISSGTLTVNHSTFTSNEVTLFGGGIFVGAGFIGSINHSTMSENNAGGLGGGIFMAGSSSLALDHSTITANVASSGGGIFVCQESPVPPQAPCNGSGTLTLTHSSVTGNTPDDIAP